MVEGFAVGLCVRSHQRNKPWLQITDNGSTRYIKLYPEGWVNKKKFCLMNKCFLFYTFVFLIIATKNEINKFLMILILNNMTQFAQNKLSMSLENWNGNVGFSVCGLGIETSLHSL